jgi:predicted MFS family arabinose efflux permease
MTCGAGQSHARWFILGLLFLARTAIAFQFQSIASSGPALTSGLGIEFAVLGTVIGLYMLPGIVFALPSGVLMQRLGTKKAMVIGLALMGAGGIAAVASNTLLSVVMGRVISGTGGVLLNVSLTKATAEWFVGREIVGAMSILITSWPLGIALGLAIFPPLAEAFGWQVVSVTASAAALLCLAMVLLLYRAPVDGQQTDAPSLMINLSGREWGLILLGGAVWTALNAGYVVLISFAPDMFIAQGHSSISANWLVSLLGWVLIFSIPAGGIVADRSRRSPMLMAGGFLAMSLIVAIVPFVPFPSVAFVLYAVASGFSSGPALALPVQALRDENRGVGTGIFYTVFYAGMALLPAVGGLARDLTGNVVAPVWAAAAMIFMAFAGTLVFQAVERSPGPDRLLRGRGA